MEEFKHELDNVISSVIDVQLDEVVYDCFVFNEEKIVVLKNEQFDEFITNLELAESEKNKKLFMLGSIFSDDNVDYIFPLNEEKYEEVLDYYLSLKKAFLEVADDE